MLRLADATSLAGSLGRFLMGIVVCFVMGLIVATVITLGLNAFFDSSGIGWMGWYGVYVLVLAPLLIWHEHRSRPDYLNDALREIDPGPTSGSEDLVNRATFWIGYLTSRLFWGPRAVIDGFRGMRGHRSITQDAVFDRAATLVLALAQANGGVPIKELIIPPENMLVFGSAVDLLDRHDCIGKSTDGRSLWLNSTYRRTLNERMRV